MNAGKQLIAAVVVHPARFDRFVERFGRATQIELDALPPDVLRTLFQAVIDEFWDTSRFQAAVRLEERERARVEELADDG